MTNIINEKQKQKVLAVSHREWRVSVPDSRASTYLPQPASHASQLYESALDTTLVEIFVWSSVRGESSVTGCATCAGPQPTWKLLDAMDWLVN